MPFLNDTEFAKSIREGNLAPVYFLFGKESFLAEGYYKKLLEKAVPKATETFNFHQFDGAEPDMTSIRVATEALPLMADRKCIVLRNPNIEKMAKEDFEALMEITEDPNPTTVFIILVTSFDLDAKKNARVKKLAETVAKNGITVDFSPKTSSELVKIIKQRVEKAGGSIDNTVAYYLIERCGSSLEQLTVEIDKLTSYRLDGAITKKDVEAVTGISLESSVFDLAKSLMKNDFNRAFRILDELFMARQEPIAILGVLNMTFVDLYRAKVAMSGAKTAEDIINIFPYRGKEFRIRNAMRDVPKYSVTTLRRCLEILSDADIALKTTKNDGRVTVEKVLASILQEINKS